MHDKKIGLMSFKIEQILKEKKIMKFVDLALKAKDCPF